MTIEIPEALLEASADALKLYCILAMMDSDDVEFCSVEANPRILQMRMGLSSRAELDKLIVELGWRQFLLMREQPLLGGEQGNWLFFLLDGEPKTKAKGWFGLFLLHEPAIENHRQIDGAAYFMDFVNNDGEVWVDDQELLPYLCTADQVEAEAFIAWMISLGWLEPADPANRERCYKLTMPPAAMAEAEAAHKRFTAALS